eukprot:1158099-Pelagomonas_calceolata.AAC.8
MARSPYFRASVQAGLLIDGHAVEPAAHNTAHGAFDAGAFNVGAFDVGAFNVGAFDVGAFNVGAFDGGTFDGGAFDGGPATRKGVAVPLNCS